MKGLRTLAFFSIHMKDKVEVIHFRIKSRGVQDLVWKVHPKFLIWKRQSWYKNDDYQFVTLINYIWKVSECLHLFMQHRFRLKPVFMKLETFFISSTRPIFIKLLSASECSIKAKVTSYWTLFQISFTSAVICKERLLLHGKEMQ